MQTEQVSSEGNDSGDALAERYMIHLFSFETKTYCRFCLIVQVFETFFF